MTDTIFAPATAPGRAAVAVVRLSGPDSGRVLRQLSGALPSPRRASLRPLKSQDGRLLDQALVLWMPGPGSYTGEDTAELFLHGGPAVVAAVVEALHATGLRLADPGEFTRRAFENGQLDLAQAEGVADLVEAETEAQRAQALEQVGGALGRAQEVWRSDLIEALGILEAAVDFPDEDLPQDVLDRARPPLDRLITALDQALADTERGVLVREGFRIALIGAPNAGKSTLLNGLVRREAAIVTATPGTTRDVIEVPVVLGGFKALLADTAGLRETEDEIEAEGVRRARAWAEGASLQLWVVDGSGDDLGVLPGGLKAGDLCLITKADLQPGDNTGRALVEARALEMEVHRLSALNPPDLSALAGVLTGLVVQRLGSGESATATRLRHRDLLTEARGLLGRALESAEAPELAAEDVRLAGRALDRVTGRIHPEDVLDRVFASFCIGK